MAPTTRSKAAASQAAGQQPPAQVPQDQASQGQDPHIQDPQGQGPEGQAPQGQAPHGSVDGPAIGNPLSNDGNFTTSATDSKDDILLRNLSPESGNTSSQTHTNPQGSNMTLRANSRDPDILLVLEDLSYAMGGPHGKAALLLGYVKLGRSKIFLEQIGPSNKCYYRLNLESDSLCTIGPDTPNLVNHRRAFEKKEDSDTYRFNQRHIRGINGVAWKANGQYNPDILAPRQPKPPGHRYPMTYTIVIWSDGVSTWETRGGMKRLLNKKADRVIHITAKMQAQRYDKYLMEGEKGEIGGEGGEGGERGEGREVGEDVEVGEAEDESMAEA